MPKASRLHLVERIVELLNKFGVGRARRRVAPSDQNVVMAGFTTRSDDITRYGAQPPFGAVAGDGVSDLF